MSEDIEVELYRPPDDTPLGRIPLAPLLNAFFEPVLGRPLAEARFILHLESVEDREEIPGFPRVVNLRGGLGYGEVTVVERGQVVYQHPHTLNEIVGGPLQQLLADRFPEIGQWGFRLVGGGLEHLTHERPIPQVAGGVGIRADGRRRRVSNMEQVMDSDPEIRTLAALGVEDPTAPLGGPLPDGPGIAVSVVLTPAARSALTQRVFSGEVEEGGFVIGHRYADGEGSGRHLIEVTAVVAAESTGASLLRFTFTGDSFLQLANLLARRGADEQILGWYHTHLFSATPEFGLSTVDVRLHTSTFRRPWQVAALVNLGRDGRVLRFFGSVGGAPDAGLTEVPYWAAEQLPPATSATSARPVAADSPPTAVQSALGLGSGGSIAEPGGRADS
jgi:hypothetical protein